MKRKRGAVKRKPKKTAAAADIVEDPPLDPDVNEDNNGLDSRMEILAREASSRMSSGRLGLDKPVVHNETAGSAAAKLARVIDSSRSKASSDRVAVQNERISEKGTKSSQQAPACNKQELEDALSVIQKIMKMNGAMPFNSPVDPIALGIPDYFDIIDVPMDFGTICSNLGKGIEYKNSEDVFEDVQRIWDNCCKYNKKGSYILELMKRVKNSFMKQWTAAGLYNNEQQTLSNGHLPDNPELIADSTIRLEESRHAYPVGSTVSSCPCLHRNDFSCLNKMQYQPLSPCCGGTFKPHHISYQCSCSVHSGQLHHGHHHQVSSRRDAGDKQHPQHQMDSVHVQAYQPSPNCMPEHQFNQNTSPQLYSSRTEGGRNIAFAGNLDVQPPTESTINFRKPNTGCSRPPSTDNSSCQQPDQINSTPEQSDPMINIETCHALQPEFSPSERTHSTSTDNNFTKRKSQGHGLSHCQEESSFLNNSQESEHELDTFPQSSFLQSQPPPPAADFNMKSKKKSRGRGPARGLKLREGERISVTTNEKGQPVGPEARKFISFLGTLARNGYFLPLTYHDWRAVPSEYKENVWREVQLRFEIDPISKESAMQSLGIAWRNWKCLLKSAHYYPHKTDQERLADRDERVPADQWAALIALWSTEAAQEHSAKFRGHRLQQKNNHVTGNKTSPRIPEEQRQLQGTKGTPQESSTQSHIVSEIIGNDKTVRPRGIELGLSSFDPRKPTQTEAMKTVSEANAEVRDMKQKVTVMEQTCAQMASQMAAMMSMISSMHRNSSDKNVPDMIANTSGASDQSLPQLAPTMPSPGASSNCQTQLSKK